MEVGLSQLTSMRDETKSLLTQLASWLGEDATKADADRMLTMCNNLIETAYICAPPSELIDQATDG